MKLDLACGQNKAPGFVGIDIVKVPGVDHVWDLTRTPWPLKDGLAEEVICSHFFEHLDGTQRIAFMDELYRVMENGAKATLVTPYWSSMRAVQDPTHKWPPVCEASFLYFNKQWRATNRLDHYPIKSDFDFTYGYNVGPELLARNQEARDFAIRSYVNAVSDLVVTLIKREPS